MEIDNHVGFSKVLDPELWKYIQSHNIPVNGREDEHVASIDMYSSNLHWPNIEAILKKNKGHWQSDTIFTKDELAQAQWMRVRTIWRTGYPQPMNGFGYQTITYTRDHYCDKCGIGLEQVDAFRIQKVPAWGRRHFLAPFWVEDELFVSEAVKNAFQDTGITGVAFTEVRDRTGKKVLDGVYQLRILNVLEKGLENSPENLRSCSICEKCGRSKSRSNVGIRVQYNSSVFDNAPDIVKTGDYFGVEGNMSPARKIIISQKTYQTIVKYKLDRSLMFYPIDLV